VPNLGTARSLIWPAKRRAALDRIGLSMHLKQRRLHLAEMLLELKFHGKEDGFRERQPFSEDLAATNAVLFNDRYDKRRKVRAYRRWLETSPNQPCVFGRVAAKNKNVFICLIEEGEILRLSKGDADLHSLIQDYRQVWKRHALDGFSSSFVIVLVSRSLVTKEPTQQLKEICRRLMELYMEIQPIGDDTFHTQREYVFLRQKMPEGKTRLLKFSTLPNIFCAQGDGRWWHDHRTPGGIMITSNALGHFTYSRTGKPVLDDAMKTSALENAMRTINNAYRGPSERKRAVLKHCPATFLVAAREGEPSPLKQTSDFKKFSADHYQGYFHTDHLIPSVFFKKDRDPKAVRLYEDLTFRYIYDPSADIEEHAELMTGIESGWYEAKRNLDRLPDFCDPEKTEGLPLQLRARLAKWLEERSKTLFGNG
jgi:hypothetical protein